MCLESYRRPRMKLTGSQTIRSIPEDDRADSGIAFQDRAEAESPDLGDQAGVGRFCWQLSVTHGSCRTQRRALARTVTEQAGGEAISACIVNILRFQSYLIAGDK